MRKGKSVRGLADLTQSSEKRTGNHEIVGVVQEEEIIYIPHNRRGDLAGRPSIRR